MSGESEKIDGMVDDLSGVEVSATWHDGQATVRRTFGLGRHLIGSSPFAAIRVKGDSEDLCGALYVSPTGILLRCSGTKPIMFVDGQKMIPGDVITLGDALEVTVGRFPVLLATGRRAQASAHMPSAQNAEATRERKLGAANALQAEVDACAADPDAVRQAISRHLLDQMNLANLELSQINTSETKQNARLKLRKLVTDLAFPDNFPLSRDELETQVFDEVMGLGPLEPLLADGAVSEIMVNRRDQIFVERGGKITLSDVSFSSDQALLNVIERIVSTVGRRIDRSSPIVDARLLDGSRVNAVIPPLALKGPNLTIRRFSKTPIAVSQLVNWGSMTAPMAQFLKDLVCSHKNVIISGGTGSGKTTLLNALSSFIPNGERIITVEDAAELQLQQEHVISLETRPANIEGKGAVTIRDLVKNTLRMRPDRIIVGECRSGEALDMLQAMNTGHDGSMTTAHANNPEDMLRRLETMVLMAGMDLPLRAIREQISSALCVVVQQTRRKTGKRLVTEIAWVCGLDRSSGEYQVRSLFSRDRKDQMVFHEEDLRKFWEVEEMDGDLEAVVEAANAAMRRSS